MRSLHYTCSARPCPPPRFHGRDECSFLLKRSSRHHNTSLNLWRNAFWIMKNPPLWKHISPKLWINVHNIIYTLLPAPPSGLNQSTAGRVIIRIQLKSMKPRSRSERMAHFQRQLAGFSALPVVFRVKIGVKKEQTVWLQSSSEKLLTRSSQTRSMCDGAGLYWNDSCLLKRTLIGTRQLKIHTNIRRFCNSNRFSP